MWIIAICAFISVCLIFTLVWLHASRPEDRFLNAAKEWQTLIGAILGFLFLSGSVLISETYQSELDADRSVATQRAYGKILSNELNLYRQDLATRSTLFALKEREFEIRDCVEVLSILREMPLTSFSIERNLVDLVPSFSDEFNFIATSAIEARYRYLKETSAIDARDCANDPVSYRDGLEAYHTQAIKSADGMQTAILSTLTK